MNAPIPDVAAVAAAMGQPARAAMLDALMGGRWLTAAELGRFAGVAPSTASEHLTRLVDAGLVVRRNSGRRRYHSLAGHRVAAALEALGRLPASATDAIPRHVPEELHFARTCYDHLAGALGVRLADALVERGCVTDTGSEITETGEAWLAELGIDVDRLRRRRRTLVRFCLDWSERRDHLAGALGAALTATLLERGWLARMDGTRAVRLSVRGRDRLHRLLGRDIGSPVGADIGSPSRADLALDSPAPPIEADARAEGDRAG
ncbi:MAG: ArsR/SmtB family transcription factor [Gemmatimonadota bacterium]